MFITAFFTARTYLSIKPNRVDGLAGGIYYYHPAEHRLDLLHAGSGLFETAYGEYGGFNQRIFEQSAFGLFLIGQLDAITPLYGDWAKDFCLLEAGYMSQLLMEMAPSLQLGLCPIGNFDFEPYQDMFNLASNQILLHSFLGGGIALEQTQQWIQSSHQSVSVSESLRHYLAQKLPAYMIPTHYIPLETLPLTPNGKVDRKALPAPSDIQSQEVTYVKPETKTEQLIAEIWQKVLGQEKIGIYDNFFDLGGDSLLMVQVQNQLQTCFSQEIPIIALFRHTTVHELAKQLTQNQESKSEQENQEQAGKHRLERQDLKQQRRQIRKQHRSKD